MAAGDPGGHVGQQEPAASHRPADPSRDARQGQDQDRQDVAPDVDAQVVAGAPERPAELPDRRPQRPAAPVALEPAPRGQADAVDVRVGLEHLAVARRGEDVDRRAGVRRAEAGQQRAGQDRVAQVVELDHQDAPRRLDPSRRPEPAPGADRDRPGRVERVHRAGATAACCSGSGGRARAWAQPATWSYTSAVRWATSDQRKCVPTCADSRTSGPPPTPRTTARAIAEGRSGRAYSTRSPKYSRVHPRGVIDHRAARQRRLQRGQPRRLEPARQREDAGRRVGRGQQRVVVVERVEPGDRAPPLLDAGAGVDLVPRRRVADDHQRQARRPQGADQAEHVLAGLDPADVEHEVAQSEGVAEQRRRRRARTSRARRWARRGCGPGRRRRGGRAAAPRPTSWAGSRRPAPAGRAASPASGGRRPSPPTWRGPRPRRAASGASAAIALGSNQQIGDRTTRRPRARATRASSSPSIDMPNRWSSRASSSWSIQGENGRMAIPRSSRCRPVWTSWFSPPPGAWKACEGAWKSTEPGAIAPVARAAIHAGSGVVLIVRPPRGRGSATTAAPS